MSASLAPTEELGPCPRCGKKRGEVGERKGMRFPWYVICKACGWITDYVKLRAVAVKLWNEAKLRD